LNGKIKARGNQGYTYESSRNKNLEIKDYEKKESITRVLNFQVSGKERWAYPSAQAVPFSISLRPLPLLHALDGH